jgi:hypothetical protein
MWKFSVKWTALLATADSGNVELCVNLTALLATADSGNVEVLCEVLKHRARVVIVIKKCSELLKVAAKNAT